jgi:hypothetical protein
VLAETLGLAEALVLGEAEFDALADGDSANVNVPVRSAGYGPAPSGGFMRIVTTLLTISTRTFVPCAVLSPRCQNSKSMSFTVAGITDLYGRPRRSDRVVQTEPGELLGTWIAIRTK